MDPSISIDLSSVAGIVTLTLALVHYLKPRLGRITFLQEFPLAVYVVAVSGGLTWLAHDVLHKLDGDLVSLIIQAVVSAMAASGLVEWWRAGSDPVAETTSATAARRAATARKGGFYIIPILLAVGLSSSACASAGRVLVEADRGIHATLSTADDVVNRACDAHLRSPADCQALNASLADSYAAYQRFNAAAQEGSIAGVPAMVTALADIRGQVLKLEPQAVDLIKDLQRWYDALKALLPKEKS